MKLTVDPEVDALYLRLNEAQIVDSEQVASGAVLITTRRTISSAWKSCICPNAAARWKWKS
jgi:hypothetical protein